MSRGDAARPPADVEPVPVIIRRNPADLFAMAPAAPSDAAVLDA
jgi:hypothetical protein